jgi:hypothetical protein
MKRLILCASIVAVGLLLVGPGEATATPRDNEDDLLAIAQKRPAKKAKHKVVHGHKTLSRDTLKSIKNGRRLIHTTAHGHQAHAVIKNGKISGLQVKDRRGNQLAVKIHKQRGTRPQPGKGRLHRISASLDDLRDAEVIPVQDTGTFIVFHFVNPKDGSQIFIFFPSTMVAPNQGGDPDPDPDPDPDTVV